MDIVTGLAAVGQALDTAKKLRDFEKNLDAASFRLEIAELMLALADTKSALATAQITIQEKDDEIRRLNEMQSSKMPVVKYKGYSFGIDADGKPIGLPFCRVCEQTNGQQNQISRLETGRRCFCPVCKSVLTEAPTFLPKDLIPAERS